MHISSLPAWDVQQREAYPLARQCCVQAGQIKFNAMAESKRVDSPRQWLGRAGRGTKVLRKNLSLFGRRPEAFKPCADPVSLYSSRGFDLLLEPTGARRKTKTK
jgi:hypothetical protein